MSSKLYVGNISWTTDEAALTTHFGMYGTVKSAKIVKDHDSGKSKGFGFVEMSSSEEAQDAISKSNGIEVGGRELRVSEAQDKPRAPRSEGGYENRGPRTPRY